VVLDRSELAAIGNLAHEYDLVIVVDEAYDNLIYDNRTHVSLATLEGMWERTITVQTCSKIYNMGGWRVGWIIGPANAIRRIEAVQSSAISCPTSFAQAGVAAALSQSIGMGEEPIGQLLTRLARQRDTLTSGLRQIPDVTCVQPGGGFFSFPNFSSFGVSSSDLSEHLLNDAGIVTIPGDAFGNNGEGHLRILFTAPQAEIVAGLDVMANSLSKLRRP
jgi:aspartate/methionine/tyrosine aminotransferase